MALSQAYTVVAQSYQFCAWLKTENGFLFLFGKLTSQRSRKNHHSQNRIRHNVQKSIRQECYMLLPDHYNWDHCIQFQTCMLLSAHSTVPLTTDTPSYNFTIGCAHFSVKCRIGYDLFNFLPCICIAGAVSFFKFCLERIAGILKYFLAPIPDLPDRKTICIMERGNEKCQPKNESTQRRRVTMRPSRRGQCGWSPSRGGPAGRWPRNSASASTRCAAG